MTMRATALLALVLAALLVLLASGCMQGEPARDSGSVNINTQQETGQPPGSEPVWVPGRNNPPPRTGG
jgi:hypothetical protein